MIERKKILWLVSWYPNKYEPFAGDFIQRHARAAAVENEIYVIFIKNVHEILHTKEVITVENGLTEQVIFFKTPSGLLGKLKKQLTLFQLYKKAFENYRVKNGLPAIVHVHIPWKAGLFALWIKSKYNIPYLITEHWNIYNDIVDDNFKKWPLVNKYLLKQIYRGSKGIVSVSKYLGNCIKEIIGVKNFVVIPNVVDTTLFYFSNNKYSKFTFIHVSNMVHLKNVKGIIDSFYSFLMASDYKDLQLIMIGNSNNEFEIYAEKLNLLNKYIFFKGEINYSDVAKEMQLSHCLVLNSNIENSPCVIGEALCCGLPVIATNVGGIPELINSKNGILIKANNVEQLQKSLLHIYTKYQKFDRKTISDDATRKYSLAVIANSFKVIYNN